MSGGISFDTPLNLDAAPPSQAYDTFVLYPDYASTDEKQFNYTLFYIIQFNGFLRGLNTGAPVEYRGIKVGEVRDIKVEMDPDSYEVSMPVLVAFQPLSGNAYRAIQPRLEDARRAPVAGYGTNAAGK